MWKATIIIMTILFLGVALTNIQAQEINNENELTIKINRHKIRSQSTNRLNDNSNAHDDFIISEGISAGFIFGPERSTYDNYHGLNRDNNGLGLGLGFSLSF